MPARHLTGTPFSEWRPANITNALTVQLDETAKRALNFYKGDHWQASAGWGGPTPDPLTTKVDDAAAFMLKVERVFTSSNVIAEVVDRHVSAVMGREPGWQFVPIAAKEGEGEGPDDETEKDPLVTEIELAIINWAAKRNAHQVMLEAMADYATTGLGMVRLFIPPGLLVQGEGGTMTLPTGLTLDDALGLVYIEKVEPLSGGTSCERSSMSMAAFVSWTEKASVAGAEQSVTRSELQYTELTTGTKRNTVMRSWDGSTEGGTLTLDLNGQLLMHEMRGKPLVTQQMIQLQKGLNFAMTAMGNNNANAGFLERIITNAQTPGSYEVDSKTGQKTFKPSDRYQGGPGSTVFLTGHAVTDDEGRVSGYTDPRPWFRDPSSPEAFRASLDEYRAAMYMEAKQGHLLAQGDGNVSGASRVHLRADFELSLRDTRVAAEQAYMWLLTVMAKLGGLFTGNPQKFDKFRPTVQANVNTGPLTDSERTGIIEQFKEGLRSRESAMVLLGVDDPDAEFLRIRGELPSNPVSLDDLALLGVTLMTEQKANLMQRAGLEVTPEQLAQMKVDEAANSELRATTAAARNRSLNPQDDTTQE